MYLKITQFIETDTFSVFRIVFDIIKFYYYRLSAVRNMFIENSSLSLVTHYHFIITSGNTADTGHHIFKEYINFPT